MTDNCPRCGGRLSEFMDWALMRYFRLCRSCGWTDRKDMGETETPGAVERRAPVGDARSVTRLQ